MSTTLDTYKERMEEEPEDESSMSFLDHLDELRSRLMRIAIFVLAAFILCWIFSDHIYNFLQVPVRAAMLDAKRQAAKPLTNALISPLDNLADGEEVTYTLPLDLKVSDALIPAKTTIVVKVQKSEDGAVSLVTSKNWLVNEALVLQAGFTIPREFYTKEAQDAGKDNQLVVPTVQGAFNLYIKVAFYAAIFFGVPFILTQTWGFIAPGLYPHEKKYAIPFIVMASLFFMLGCAFSYYIAFPRAANFLLGVATAGNLTPLVTADEYFDLILTITLGLGVVFEIPTVTFFLARLGLVSHRLLLKVWRFAIIVIFIVAALLSPTTDVPNLLVFAAPMMVLYFFSVGIAWLFHKDRKAEE